jgi:dimethylargininase
MFRHAIVRPPAANFADGLTTVDLGTPIFATALEQHARYCEALERCGLAVTSLPPDPRHPDSTFVEDAAILPAGRSGRSGGAGPAGGVAILTRPGAPSREGEVPAIREALGRFFRSFRAIEPPGTLDGGDICEAEAHVFIGVSRRTNEEGARQLAAFLAGDGLTSSVVDIRDLDAILHLKSGIASLGENRLALIEPLAEHPAFRGYDIVRVDPAENYAANCVRVNNAVLVAAGYPKFHSALHRLGYRLVSLDMSEYQKMDGGLSCLSLRL